MKYTLGYLMDMKVLQECVRANVGDLTFEVHKPVPPKMLCKERSLNLDCYI